MQDVSCWLKLSVYFRILDLFFLSSFPKRKSGISCWEQCPHWIGHNFIIPAYLYSRNSAIHKAAKAVLRRWEGLKVLQAFLSNNSHLFLLVHLLNPLCKYHCEFLTAVGLCSPVSGWAHQFSPLCGRSEGVCRLLYTYSHKAEGRILQINTYIIKGFLLEMVSVDSGIISALTKSEFILEKLLLCSSEGRRKITLKFFPT